MVTREDYDKLQQYYGEIPDFMQDYLKIGIMIRLKKIGMLCGIDQASHNYKYSEFYTSRFDHSFGTAMTVWRLTHDKKLTLAALFHDISTPVFSHVIDFLNGDYVDQESTEEMTEAVLNSSQELKELLKNDRLTIIDLANFKDYSVVDLERPKMCADRLNNVMTVGMGWLGELTLEEAKTLVDGIHLEKNEDNRDEIAFNSREIAKIYLDINDKVNERLARPDDGYLTNLLVEIVRRCIKRKYVAYAQLFTFTEEQMFEIIEYYCVFDNILKEMYNTFKTIKEIPQEECEHDRKLRLVNPLVNGRRYFDGR